SGLATSGRWLRTPFPTTPTRLTLTSPWSGLLSRTTGVNTSVRLATRQVPGGLGSRALFANERMPRCLRPALLVRLSRGTGVTPRTTRLTGRRTSGLELRVLFATSRTTPRVLSSGSVRRLLTRGVVARTRLGIVLTVLGAVWSAGSLRGPVRLSVGSGVPLRTFAGR